MSRQFLPEQLSTTFEDPFSPAATFLLFVFEGGSAAGSRLLGATSADTAVELEDVGDDIAADGCEDIDCDIVADDCEGKDCNIVADDCEGKDCDIVAGVSVSSMIASGFSATATVFTVPFAPDLSVRGTNFLLVFLCLPARIIGTLHLISQATAAPQGKVKVGPDSFQEKYMWLSFAKLPTDSNAGVSL